MAREPFSILVVTTKPPYPPIDGGRLLMWSTLRELAAAGHEVTLVSPTADAEPATAVDLRPLTETCRVRLVQARPRRLPEALVISRVTRQPLSGVRHAMKAVCDAVDDQLASGQYDVIHVEQVQAMPNVPDRSPCPPIVLRCQNVESRLWEMLASHAGIRGSAARWEGRMMRRFEAGALRRATLSLALTEHDREELLGLSGLPARSIRTVTAPFPAELPTSDSILPGTPAIVLVDGPWWPFREATDWFLDDILPAVRRATPDAVVHCYGNRPLSPRQGMVHHPAPEESSTLFPSNAILAVPLRIASGLRMKILESWARGVPVVATPDAARGLEAQDGRNLLIARSPQQFAGAIQRLATDKNLLHQVIRAGRETLLAHHDPGRVGHAMAEAYRVAMEETRSSQPPS